MKLYYSPGTCSLSPHIALREAALDFTLVKVDSKTKTTEHGADYWKINPHGYVPALELDDGEVLTEGPAIVQYIADLKPQAQLAPANGTLERTRLQSALGFINSELHKGIGGLFAPNLSEADRTLALQKIDVRLQQVAAKLEGRPWLVNGSYSAADGYLYNVLRWLKFFDVDLGRWPLLAAHSERVAARPAVQAALKAEGLN